MEVLIFCAFDVLFKDIFCLGGSYMKSLSQKRFVSEVKLEMLLMFKEHAKKNKQIKIENLIDTEMIGMGFEPSEIVRHKNPRAYICLNNADLMYLYKIAATDLAEVLGLELQYLNGFNLSIVQPINKKNALLFVVYDFKNEFNDLDGFVAWFKEFHHKRIVADNESIKSNFTVSISNFNNFDLPLDKVDKFNLCQYVQDRNSLLVNNKCYANAICFDDSDMFEKSESYYDDFMETFNASSCFVLSDFEYLKDKLKKYFQDDLGCCTVPEFLQANAQHLYPYVKNIIEEVRKIVNSEWLDSREKILAIYEVFVRLCGRNAASDIRRSLIIWFSYEIYGLEKLTGHIQHSSVKPLEIMLLSTASEMGMKGKEIKKRQISFDEKLIIEVSTTRTQLDLPYEDLVHGRDRITAYISSVALENISSDDLEEMLLHERTKNKASIIIDIVCDKIIKSRQSRRLLSEKKSMEKDADNKKIIQEKINSLDKLAESFLQHTDTVGGI